METETKHEQLDALIASLGLDYMAVFVPQSQSRNAKEKEPSLNWTVQIRKDRNTLKTDYMQGIGHLPNYSHVHSRLAVYDDAVREACETGRSRIVKHKNGYDAAGGGYTFPRLQKIPEPSLREVLYCLVLDASAIDYATFEDWTSEYGYDKDSRSAEKIYRQCLETGLKLRAMLGNETLEKLREFFQDY